jgi:uncharacterized protein YbjT (DUF2867 family)
MYAIVGITGNTGRVVAEKLLSEGQSVRGIFRSTDKAERWRLRGAETAIGTLSDTSAITKAFRGTDGVYIMTPTYHDADDMFAENLRDLANLKEAITVAEVPKVVLLSSIGAHLQEGTGPILKLRAMEQLFFDLPVSCASIRAAWFMENFAGVIENVRKSGVLPSFLDRTIPMVATRDIGKLAAGLLQGSWKGIRIIELEGPRRYSPNDVAAAFEAVLGRKVVAQAVDRNEWASIYQDWGLSPKSAKAMTEMIDGFNRGWIVFEGGKAEHSLGETSLEEVLSALEKTKSQAHSSSS